MSSEHNDEEPMPSGAEGEVVEGGRVRVSGALGRVTGGLGSTVQKNDEVTEIVDKIKPVLEEKSGKKFESLEVLHYRPQLVAGMNYFVKAKAKVDGADQIVHLRIYQNLKKELELTAYQLNKQLEEELEYFQ